MAFVWKEVGGDRSTEVSISVLNFIEAEQKEKWPLVDFEVIIKNDDIYFRKDAHMRSDEIMGLSYVFDDFVKGNREEYFEWSHVNRDLLFSFVKEYEYVTVKIKFDPSDKHISGYYFEMLKDDYTAFNEYLKKTIGR